MVPLQIVVVIGTAVSLIQTDFVTTAVATG